MIYFDTNNKSVIISSDYKKIEQGFYRLTVTEAMSIEGTSKNEGLFLSMVGPSDNDFLLDNHNFGIITEDPSIVATQELWDYVRGREKDFMILRRRNWKGIIYHHSKDINAVLSNGWENQRTVEDDGSSFGLGLYCYYRRKDLLKPDLPNLLVAEFSGDLYTTVIYEDYSHDNYGYIPYDYQNLEWKVYCQLSDKEKSVIESKENIF